ncbi:excinuclease ABC subunit UvrB [Peptostreptococcus canis]|uniref:UvrABC system protein B n=1 Tax=Peptostreptococcus canis TaxID=1159213 RepID=A0ABR6TJ82_9FIRM|nr:excinuclease ABC subunit UvrB [Peptostreptococcus canis]MBC2575481.1 excinuclease ABC subunit UvrB [Peptostreptococcus canis]MBP1997327.1 excinuclease ABC subunit B [Peptostreptococcus canis]
MEFKLVSDYKPTGDQPQAIEKITESIKNGNKYQTLLGVTGSGKTFTMANIIKNVGKPTLVLAHNKTLAAQLYSEFKEFFPDNAVEYFVSYYDYYQPEAYVAHSDTYIEKDASINDEIDKLRHSATASILERRDTVIISSVSCIYGLGDPKDYKELMLSLRPGMLKDRDDVIKRLVEIQYERNDINFIRGTFRVRGDILEIFPAGNDERAIRLEFFGDEIDRITEIDYVTGKIIGERNHVVIFPASHYVTTPERIEMAIKTIESELVDTVKKFKDNDKLLEAQRIEQRTNYDIEMLREIGFCQGIENYSRHITGRNPGEKPYTLMDFFPDDFLLIVDESHVTIPQVRGMYAGDKSRKKSLIENGFRLESAYDNRPLNFEEFEENINQILFTTATPGPYEIEHTNVFAEQIIRPTGLLDPIIDVRPVENQIDNLVVEINRNIENGERVLITTLTKKMSEDLTNYLVELGIKVKYLHSDIVTLERTEIIRDLRLGKFDVLVGINLLREGLDIPEVSLIAILDADKEGFLRSETSLIQTIGRAARNSNGRVIMYADRITDSMKRAIDETERRRSIQMAYNKSHNIVPKTIRKDIRDNIEATRIAEEVEAYTNVDVKKLKDDSEITSMIIILKSEMMLAAENLEFEKAAELRDKIMELEKKV